MKNVMGPATESEVGDVFHNDQETEPILTTPHNTVHTQPSTRMQTDNSTTNGIVKIKCQKTLKAIDIRFY